jgi:hypothetical protein
MLDCAPWILTHSSVGAAELASALELVPAFGLEATKASRDAAVVVAAAAEPVCEADPVCEAA